MSAAQDSPPAAGCFQKPEKTLPCNLPITGESPFFAMMFLILLFSPPSENLLLLP